MSKISDLLNNQLINSEESRTTISLDSVINDKIIHKKECALSKVKKEMVNHPQHYQSKNGMEAIDVIEAFDLGFNLGNVIKYILRAGKKDATVQELEKAKWYLEREINKLKEN